MSQDDPDPRPDAAFVLDSLVASVFVFDENDRLAYLNNAGESLLSRSFRDASGKTAPDLFGEDAWLLKLLGRIKESPETSLRAEGVIETSGRSIEGLAVASKLHNRDGRVEGTTLALHDVASRQWLRSSEQNRRRLAEVDTLVASIAHEINNPLTGIRGAAQLLATRLREDPKARDRCDLIVRQVDRLTTLVDTLMRLEATVPRQEPVNIHRVLNEIVSLNEQRIRENKLIVNTRFDPSLPEILGDEDQLQQVFLNIVNNAIRAGDERDLRLALVTRMENNFYIEREDRRLRYIAVEISDNGPGFGEDVADKLFAPFFTTDKEGTGLGLSIARKIVDAHGGHISARNLDAGGAMFRVILPAAEAAATDPPPVREPLS